MADVVEQAGEAAPFPLWNCSHQGADVSLNSDEGKGICGSLTWNPQTPGFLVLQCFSKVLFSYGNIQGKECTSERNTDVAESTHGRGHLFGS